MRPTIKDVAERAGVSTMTVSSILRGRVGEASEATRDRVLNVVRELEYVPVRAASQNRHVQTHVIGVVFDEVDAATDEWGLMTLRGLRQGALERGYDLLLLLRPAPDWTMERTEAQYLDRRTDGIIFVAPVNRSEVLAALVEHKVPVVTCYDDDVPAGVAHVVADNVLVGRLATEHLIACGHRRIAHFPGDLQKSYLRHRLEGYRHAMKAANLEPLELEASTAPDLMPQIHQLKQLMDWGVTAVLCDNDIFAQGLMWLAKSVGIEVPRQLSVVGVDDTREAKESGLTTVRIDGAEIGKLAIDALIERIQGKTAEDCHRVPGVHLVERTSVATIH